MAREARIPQLEQEVTSLKTELEVRDARITELLRELSRLQAILHVVRVALSQAAQQ